MSYAVDTVKTALIAAFQLGQVYWQQADSEYPSQWKKSDLTKEKFNELIKKTINDLEHIQ